MGTGQAFGEATILGYIRTFPKDYVSGWSSGTGFAGIFGASLSFLFKLIKENLDLKYLYLIISPIIALFFLAFYTTFKIKKNIDYKIKLEKEKNLENTDIASDKKDSINLEEDELDYNKEATDVSKNKKMSLENFIMGFKYGKRYILNMFLVYFLEYTVCSGFCERANYFGYINSKGMFFEKAQYETFLLCYQIGVFISRSSLFIFKYLTFVELLNIFQFINFIFWLIEAIKGFVSNQWLCFFTLILLGLCGGGVYVGCFYFILNDNKILPEYKELCLNIGTIFVDSGVLLSSIVCIIVDNILKK
jgi:battenin